MDSDAFAAAMGGFRRGAERRPSALVPHVILLRGEEYWMVQFLPETNELLLSLDGLGIDDSNTEANRELIGDVGAFLSFMVCENPAVDYEELNELADYALGLFRAMPLTERSRTGQLP